MTPIAHLAIVLARNSEGSRMIRVNGHYVDGSQRELSGDDLFRVWMLFGKSIERRVTGMAGAFLREWCQGLVAIATELTREAEESARKAKAS